MRLYYRSLPFLSSISQQRYKAFSQLRFLKGVQKSWRKSSFWKLIPYLKLWIRISKFHAKWNSKSKIDHVQEPHIYIKDLHLKKTVLSSHLTTLTPYLSWLHPAVSTLPDDSDVFSERAANQPTYLTWYINFALCPVFQTNQLAHLSLSLIIGLHPALTPFLQQQNNSHSFDSHEIDACCGTCWSVMILIFDDSHSHEKIEESNGVTVSYTSVHRVHYFTMVNTYTS